MLRLSSLPRHAASAIGNSRIAACFADSPKASPKAQPVSQGLSANFRRSARKKETDSSGPAIGEAMARAGLISASRGGGNVESRARGSDSAMVVEAVVMAEMLVMVTVMMASPFGIGVQHARRQMNAPELGIMRAPAVTGRHRRRGENGNCKQRGGNCLQHGCLLGIAGVAGRMAGPVDHGFEPNGRALNPI